MKYKIQDLLEKVIDNRGKTPPVSETGHILLEINSLVGSQKFPDYGVIRKKVSEDIYNSWFRSGHPMKNDILIPTVGTLDAIAVMDRNDCCIAQNIIAFRTNKQICDPEFLYYTLCDKNTRKRLLSLDIGGVQPSIKVPHLKQLEIEIPELNTQKRISKVLSSIDEKITLNSRTNDNLFEVAQAIYREWFIDFHYPESNGQLVESELGEIPEGWTVGFIDDKKLTKIIKSGVDQYSGKKKYVATADVDGRKINSYEPLEFSERPSRANMEPIKNSVWFAKMENSVKNILVTENARELVDEYIFSTGFMGLECLLDSTLYIWNYINSDSFLEVKNGLSTGTLMAGISNSTIRSAKYLIPPHDLLIKFNEKVSGIFEQIRNNDLENERLTKLRDTLLPELLNGKIDVSNIDI